MMYLLERINQTFRGIAPRRAIASLLVAAECFSAASAGVPTAYAETYEGIELSDQITGPQGEEQWITEVPEDSAVTEAAAPGEAGQVSPAEAAELGAQSAEQAEYEAELAAYDAESAAYEAESAETYEAADAAALGAADAAKRAVDAADRAAREAAWAEEARTLAEQEAQNAADEAARAAEDAAYAAQRVAELESASEKPEEQKPSPKPDERAETTAAPGRSLASATPKPEKTPAKAEESTKPAAAGDGSGAEKKAGPDSTDRNTELENAREEAQRLAAIAAQKAELSAQANALAERAREAAKRAGIASANADAAANRAIEAANRARTAAESLADAAADENTESGSGTEEDKENTDADETAQKTLHYSDAAVTVTGEVPMGVMVKSADVSEAFQNFDPETDAALFLSDEDVFEASDETAVPVKKAKPVLLAAYDISLLLDGEPYQPENGSALEVSITIPEIPAGAQIQLWHIHDDATAEEIEDFKLDGNTITFTAESFSVYAVVQVTLTTNITASDGNTYSVSVTYDQDANMPENANLAVRELGDDEKENYVNQSAEALGIDAESFSFARAFDISLLDPATGKEVQPAGGVKVSISLLDMDVGAAEKLNLLHFGKEVETVDYTLNGNAVEFEADGFSVYVLTGAKEPFHDVVVIQSLEELSQHNGDSYSYYLSYVDKTSVQRYFTNAINGKNAFVETPNIGEASEWYFESAGQSNKYYIYTFVSGNAKSYIKQKDSSNEIQLTVTKADATILELKTSEGDYLAASNKYFFRVNNQVRWLQHSGGGGGIRFYTTYQDTNDSTNNTNTQIIITYVDPEPTLDYYELDGKIYGIAYNRGDGTGIGLTRNATAQAVQIDSENHLTAPDGTVTRWTFTCIGGANYTLSTKINGATKYLALDDSGPLISDDPCTFMLNSDSSGNISLNANGRYLFSDGTTFSSSDTEAWLCLAILEDLDVSWNEYSYAMKENWSATLDEIFSACGITGVSSDDVVSMTATNTDILKVEGLTVTCLKDFKAPQTLTLELVDGKFGTIKIRFAGSDNLNEFLDAGTVYSVSDETDTHPLSVPAIMTQNDVLHLTLSFSEIPEGEEGERQMALLSPMTFTFPQGLAVEDLPASVTIHVKNGEEDLELDAALVLSTDDETGVQTITLTGDYGEQAALVSASPSVSFTVPVSVRPALVPGSYALGHGYTLSAVRPRNVKVSSFTAGDYDAETDTITYTARVEAESDLDFDGKEYFVEIADRTTGASPALQFVSGSYTYDHRDGLTVATPTQIGGEAAVLGTATDFGSLPLTVAHMYDGDIIELTYTAKPLHGTYNKEAQIGSIQNIFSITSHDAEGNTNPSNSPDDDARDVTTENIPCTLLTREYVTLDGSWAYWRVTVNPDAFMLNEGRKLTLADTFDDNYPTKETKTDAGQSIDYSSISVSAGDVTYDYSGSTGTFVIPDSTPVTITYRTRITAQPGEEKYFRGTAVLKTDTAEVIATATAGVTEMPVAIFPSASDVAGSGNYIVKLYVYGDKMMQQGIEGATFILLDANQRAQEYQVGENKGEPVTFTTGLDGYVNIELHEEAGDISIEKNTGYYLEMMQAVEGYQKDNTLYSFMITDDPNYKTGSFYQYYNGDTMKVRLYDKTPGLSVSIRFSGSYALRDDQKNGVTAVLQMMDDNDHWVNVESHPYSDTQWGAIAFQEKLFNESLQYQNTYRVIIQNESPWDLPEYIHVETKYYSMVNTAASKPMKDPQTFFATDPGDSVNVVIDNRYEEPQLTIVKMDKQTGKVLPGTVFTVYEVRNGVQYGDAKKTYTTDTNGEIVIRGGEPFQSETLYGVTETGVVDGYLLPQNAKWQYFYFCNDDYLEDSILANLPAGATAVNLTGNGDRITIDNQPKRITVPVMKLWQGNTWPEGAQVVIGLYRAVEGVDEEAQPVLYEDNTPRIVTLNSGKPYNNEGFSDLPSRDEQDRNYIYSIREEFINGIVPTPEGQEGVLPLDAGYNQEYGISSAGVYIVRNKPATTLTVTKEWLDWNGATPSDLSQQPPVTFDVYRSTARFVDSTPDDGVITDADMAAFVSGLVKVREKLSFGPDENWTMSIRDLDRQNDLGDRYYYYVLETVPSFGNELYELDEDAGTVKITNTVAPESVNLTVTKAALVGDPREESLERDFEFTVTLKKDDTHPIRYWTLADPAEGKKIETDWDGSATFTLKPTNPDPLLQPTEGASITLSLPRGVEAIVTEAANPEYTVETTANVTGTQGDAGRTFSFLTDDLSSDGSSALSYTNTLHVICKVVKADEALPQEERNIPFESLKSALAYIRENPNDFTEPWTIYLLEDYTILATDGIELAEGESLTLTTASTDENELFHFEGGEKSDRAVITRGGVGGSILKNRGALTLENIILDGAKGSFTAAGSGGLVYSTGTLNLATGTTLRNSAASGKGGAVYAEGTVTIIDGVEITGNSAPSASALYLDGTLSMRGGSITGNTGASNGAVVVDSSEEETTEDEINLSGSPVILNNTNNQNKAANLYIGADSDTIVNVIAPGLSESAHIGVTAMDGHIGIGDQFATAEYEQTANLNRFVNDIYGYRGKLKDGTTTNVIWDGLEMNIIKSVDPDGANPNDRFTITLSSMSIVTSNYLIKGTMDYSVSVARQNRPGMIILRNVKDGDLINISPLPVGDYTITETASDYTPRFTLSETGSSATPTDLAGGAFHAENDSSITVTNTRRLAAVRLTKTLDDRLKAADETQPFAFSVRLIDADGTPVSGFTLAEGIVTEAGGTAAFTMSPSYTNPASLAFRAPVGAAMTITETDDPNYRITASARTMPAAGEETQAAAIRDEDEDNGHIFAFTVSDDGADVTFANVRKMAEIELRKNLVGKVSETESFAFTVTLIRADGQPAAAYMMYRDEQNPDNSIITDENGTALITFAFGRDESTKAIPLTIPDGTKLTVAETEIKKDVAGTQQPIYTTKYSLNEGTEKTGLSVTINQVSDDDHSIVFTNTRKTNTIVVKNVVNGYSGNTQPFTYTVTLTDGLENDYDANDFTDGVMSFELTTGQTRTLTVPYGATLTVTEGFIVGYGTKVKHAGNSEVEDMRSDTFVVTGNIAAASPILFTNSQLIGLRIVNNTSSTLVNVKITVDKNNIYLVNEDQTEQERISTNKTATISVDAGKTAILEIQHDTSATAEQNYTVNGRTPAVGYYYTINNEPSFHETANPAILRVYDAANYEVKGKLRYSVQDSTVTFTEQPLVSFDVNGGAWTTEMEDYHDKDGSRQVYQKAVTSGETAAAPTPAPVYPTAEGITFLGWTADEAFAKEGHTAGEDISAKAYNFTAPVTAPVTLWAVWAKPARSTRTVTLKNSTGNDMNLSLTLVSSGRIGEITLADAVVTDRSGTAGLTLVDGNHVNLSIPDSAKLVIQPIPSGILSISNEFTDSDSAEDSYTIASVKRDGTITFLPGVCKITDGADRLLYDGSGKPAVYATLDAAFTAYGGTLYTDASHTTPADQAAVKMLVDEYEIGSLHTFPNKTMTLTTAGRNDADFPYMGVRDRSTLRRSADGAGSNCFLINKGNSNITLTAIVLDGGSERGVKIAGTTSGGLVRVEAGSLNVNDGTTLRNCEFADYSDATYGVGGAIYVKGGTLNVSAGLFTDLHARRGGAICCDNSGSLNISGTGIRFENCYAETDDGGAIYYSVKKDLVINGGTTLSDPGILFIGCQAKTGSGDGGAIYASNAFANSVTVSGCKFTECSARVNTGGDTSGNGGGAIAAYQVLSLTVKQCTFSVCDTLRGGGAITTYIQNGQSVSINGCAFDSCNCMTQGGAVAAYQKNNSNSNSTLYLTECTFTNCSSGTQNSSGGAVQCYLPRMEFMRTSFSDCWAGKEGGAVNNFFGGNYNDAWSGSYLKLEDCHFTRCRAEDRFEIKSVIHYGGAINTKVQEATVKNCEFTDCVSTLRDGGALHLGGCGTGSKASIENSIFSNCSGARHGGAVFSSAATLTVKESTFTGCTSTSDLGGAVYHGMNCREESNVKEKTEIIDCTFSGCSAKNSGGAVWTAARRAEIEGCTMTNCSSDNGGAVYFSSKDIKNKLNGSREETSTSEVDVTLPVGALTRGAITGGSITGCEANNGSAVYVGTSAIFSGNLEVTDNIARGSLASGSSTVDITCGAIQTVDAGKLSFEGNVKVEDNTCSADSTDNHDVLMQINGNTIIYTTENGLGSGAHIGVYVPDPNSAFANHGQYGQPFGTYHNSNAGTGFLDAFFNNRDSLLYGYQGEDEFIHWGFYVCKITDEAGNTLKRENGRPAVYQQLSQALDEFTLVKNDNGETGKAVYIKMLVEDYAIRQAEPLSNFPAGADITLTTAAKSDADNPYRGTEGTVCTIYRTNSENPLFSLGTNATFQLEGITLDGRKTREGSTGDYKLITATDGEIVVNGGATLQYAKGDKGAAIDAVAVKIKGSLDAEGKQPAVKFVNCTADGSGGAIHTQTLEITGSTEKGRYGTAFINCTAAGSGGAIHASGATVKMTGASFTGCRSTGTGAGGILSHDNTEAAASATITNCRFNGGEAKGAGGAISSNAAALTVDSSVFDACKAQSNGGAISHTGSTSTELRDCTFDGSRTTDTATGFGGSVYTEAATVTLRRSEVKNSTAAANGGALCCLNSNADVTVSGTRFEGCSVTGENGSGGAIYSRYGTVTLQAYIPEGGTVMTGTVITDCTAPGCSGAVYMETSGSTLNITDNTEISRCYADYGGAIYLPAGVTMNLSGSMESRPENGELDTRANRSPSFTQNGYATRGGNTLIATDGACIYLQEGSTLRLKGYLTFSRNTLINKQNRDGCDEDGFLVNGGVTGYPQQDIYLQGYESSTPFDTNAVSIWVVGELSGEKIMVWPERSPHKLANEQFAKIESGVAISDDAFSIFRNALADSETDCKYGEHLGGVRLETDLENVYWDKMHVVSFKKKDNKGVSVPGAGFTLYKDIDCRQPVATAFSSNSASLVSRGEVEFSSVRIGVYYMKETTVPTSFKENEKKYLVLVGSQYLSPNEHNTSLWQNGGPLDLPDAVPDAATLVARYTINATGKYYGIFELDANNKAVLKANIAGSNVGVINVRNDFQAAFMKVDSEEDPLPGAAFTIYTQMLDSNGRPDAYADGYPKLMLWSRDGETYPDPVVSADGTDAFKDRLNGTLPKGLVYFRELPIGTYFLLETSYPERNGDGRRTYYAERDRVFRMDITENPDDAAKVNVTLSEWQPAAEGNPAGYAALSQNADGYYVVSNQEVVCKLTDADDNLLYEQGQHMVSVSGEADENARLFPAVYTTLEEGFAAAGSRTFVYANGNPADVSAIKLKVLKDFSITSPILYTNSERRLTFTTAETRALNDRYIYSTTRTSDTSRALISRAYNEDNSRDANAGALIILGTDTDLTLQNIRLNGQKSSYNGRAIHVTGGSSVSIRNNTRIEDFRQEAADESTGVNDVKGGAILMDDGTSLTIDGGYNRSAVFADNAVVNNRLATSTATDGKTYTGSDGGAIAVGADCSFDITNAQFTGNTASAKAVKKGNGGAVSINKTKDAEGTLNLPITNVVFSGNSASYQGGAIRVAENCSLTVQNSIFRSNAANTFESIEESIESPGEGGAIAVLSKQESPSALTITGGEFTGNSALGSKGGAVKIGGYGTLTIGGSVTMSGNKAANGGAVTVAPGAAVTMNGGTISGNTATANGGAFYVEGKSTTGTVTTDDGEQEVTVTAAGSLTILGGSITGNTASLGSAFYVDNYAEATVTNAGITGNKAGADNGGAFNVGGANARLYFGGSPTVFDNVSKTDTAQQKNVVLNVDYNDVINTTADGLVNGVIGVYVIESDDTVFENHGLPGKPFGTFGDTGRANPQVFRSDHALALYGVRNEDVKDKVGENVIYWVDVICKLTDENDRILYQDISLNINGKKETRKAQAVYARITEPSDADKELLQTGFNALRDGFDAAQGTLYARNGASYSAAQSGTVKLKMLQDYALEKGIVHAGSARGVVFTTAELESNLTQAMKTNGDFFAYRGEQTDSRALITRAFADNASMIEASGLDLRVSDITLDSAKNTYNSVTVPGGIVHVSANGSLTVADGAALQNAATTGNGGAVYVEANGTVTVSGGTIRANTAANGGALYVDSNATAAVTGGEINGNTCTGDGAGIYLAWSDANNYAVLRLSGDPSFGGTGTADPSGSNAGAAIGPQTENGVITNGNYSQRALTQGSTNGQQNYSTVRQDIFAPGFRTTGSAAGSIVVTGAVNMAPGSLWVWLEEQEHYEMLKQFAVFESAAVKNALRTNDTLDSTMRVFRNAREDLLTLCGADYLTGQEGDDIGNLTCLYWTGGFDFLFRKIDSFGEPLDGAVFTLYKADATGNAIATDAGGERIAYQVSGPTGKTAARQSSRNITAANAVTIKYTTDNGRTINDRAVYGDGLVAFEKVPPGTYFLVETAGPKADPNDTSATAPTYRTSEEMYRIVLDGKGWYTITVPVKSGNSTSWAESPKTDFANDGSGKYTVAAAGAAGSIGICTVLNVSPYERKVILRKVNGSYQALPDARFTLYHIDAQTVVSLRHSGADGTEHVETLENLTAQPSGAFWIGKLPYGVYCLKETRNAAGAETELWFVLTVNENGVGYRETDGSFTNKLEHS